MIHLTHLRALETAGLIRLATTQPDLEYTFRHALQQEAVYHTLSKFARMGAHRAVAEVLEAGYTTGADGTQPGELAHHFAEAGQWSKALDYACRAGAREQAMYAPREALVYFDRALAAARQLRTPAPWSLLRARGQVLETLGRLDEARADFEQALSLARQTQDRRAEWQSLLDLGFLWVSTDYSQAGERFRAALELARALDDPASLGHSLNRVGNWHLNIEEPEIARQYHHEALAIFERLGDTHSVAQTLDLLGLTNALMNALEESRRHYTRAIALFRELGDRPGFLSAQTVHLLRTLTYETEMLACVDLSLSEIRQVADEGLSMARAIGHRAAETFLLGTLALAYGPRGQYAEALEAAVRALEIAEEIQHRQWTAAAHYTLGVFYLDVLALPLARQHLEAGLALAQQTNTRIWVHNTSGALAQVCASEYRAQTADGPRPDWHTRPLAEWPAPLARAREVLDTTVRPNAVVRTTHEANTWHGRGQMALACGDPAAALAVADELDRFSAANWPGGPVVPAVRLLRAEALAVLGRPAEALLHLEAARERARAQGAVSTLWRVHQALGRVHQALGQPAAAESAQAAAQALVTELAQQLPAGHLRENFLTRALAF